MTKTIGEYFRQARIDAHLDAEEVCQQTGLIELEQLLELESDRSRPPLDTLYALVNRYNLDPDEFIELLYQLAKDGEQQTNLLPKLKI